MFDNIKVTAGKRKVALGNVASIQNKDDKYILDLTSSPNVSNSSLCNTLKHFQQSKLCSFTRLMFCVLIADQCGHESLE